MASPHSLVQAHMPESWDPPLVSVEADSDRSPIERRNRFTKTDDSSLESFFSVSPAEDDKQEIESTASRPKVVPMPTVRAPTRESTVLQQWDGTVEKVLQDSFLAVLRAWDDLSSPTVDEAVFDLNDISPGDRHLLSPGARFIWTVSRERSVDGQILNIDFIRFLRLPAWSKREIRTVKQRAAELQSRFGGSGSQGE